MPEIWVPYGQVEVSFDVKQENLSQIIEPAVQKLSGEELNQKVSESIGVGADAILVLSGSSGVSQVLDQIIAQTNRISNLYYYPKRLGSFAKKKAQDHIEKIQKVDLLKSDSLADTGEAIDGKPARVPSEIKDSANLAVLTSLHYDPLFGISSAASDVVRTNRELNSEAYRKSKAELPCPVGVSDASMFAMRLLQTCPNVGALEVIERKGIGVLGLFSGEPESTHAKAMDFWTKTLEVQLPAKGQRIVFGCGGGESDASLTESLARSFFNITAGAALPDSGSRLCMLADCSDGLGSEAFLNHVTGRLDLSSMPEDQYFEGLEVLVSLERVRGDLDLTMVSTLPKFYGEKFGFKMKSGAKDAPASVVPQGSKAKMLVVPDASTTFFKVQ